MKHLPSSVSPFITVVCCVHGDEVFGLDVYRHLEALRDVYPDVQLILANEEAIAAKKRFVETDLNRSFPGSESGSLEERLAAQILPLIRDSKYVIDIHTTTSDIRLTPIVTCLSRLVLDALSHVPSTEIAFMQAPLGRGSMIGQLHVGVSLEFGETYARTPDALQDVMRVVDGLRSRQNAATRPRRVYCVDGTIPLDVTAGESARNFKYFEPAKGYPFLLHERSYPGILGMCASSVIELPI